MERKMLSVTITTEKDPEAEYTFVHTCTRSHALTQEDELHAQVTDTDTQRLMHKHKQIGKRLP